MLSINILNSQKLEYSFKMPCNINPNNIDSNYPIAGQDNDSQGFRDNFTNIKNNFVFAKSEIEDLQTNVILKNALTGTTLSNDMNGAVLYRPQLRSNSSAFTDLGPNSGIVTLSFLDSNVQKITTNGQIELVLADFPTGNGIYSTMRLWLSIQNTVDIVTLPNKVVYGLDNISGYNSSTKAITFAATGDYMFEFSTADGGTTFWIAKIA
jgi:hypothetical protein